MVSPHISYIPFLLHLKLTQNGKKTKIKTKVSEGSKVSKRKRSEVRGSITRAPAHVLQAKISCQFLCPWSPANVTFTASTPPTVPAWIVLWSWIPLEPTSGGKGWAAIT